MRCNICCSEGGEKKKSQNTNLAQASSGFHIKDQFAMSCIHA